MTILANRWLVRQPDLVVYNSESCRQQHRGFGFAPRCEAVVANGFDLDRFRPDPVQRDRGRREWGLGDEDCAVGLLARWHPIKNHQGFFAAATVALKSHPKTVLVLAGEDIDPSNAELMALIRAHGLASRVKLLGHIDSVDQVIVSLDLLVSASWGEAFPNVVGEALACGVPCLATDVGESKVLVGNAGMVVDHGQLAEALVALLDKGREGLATLGIKGREQMEQSYHQNAMVERYGELLESTVLSKGSKV
jgi:glycosyltransferase involved in cell wall biosynthesis